jgi:hypothetical protein
MAKPPLGLVPEVEAANGDTFRLDGTKASTRPSGMSFSTLRGDGFGPGGYTLNRKILRDYPDLNLLDTHRFIAKNEDIAYEARHHSNPRGNDPQQQIQVALVGWMNYLKGRKASPLILDRRLGGWGPPSMQRRANLIAANIALVANLVTGWQAGEEKLRQGIAFDFNGARSNSAQVQAGEAWWFGGGEDVGEFRYFFRAISTYDSSTESQWEDRGMIVTDDIASAHEDGLNHHQVTNSKAFEAIVEEYEGRKYVVLKSRHLTGASGNDMGAIHAWLDPRIFGRHSLEKRGDAPNEGFEITDVMRYVVETYYPKVAFAGERNTYPVKQATWHDNPSFGYDILQQLNDLALWELDVFEGPTLHHRPADLTTYDWVIDTSDPGTTVLFQGDSVETFANGISVTYTDLLTGTTRALYPSDHPELRDETESNPANLHGEELWTDADVPWPALEDDALQYGRAKLAEFNRRKRPGQYRISSGYVKDGAGHWQQGWRVRDGQTLGIKDHPDDAPRLIHATNWDDDSKTLTVTVDAPPKTLEAVVARTARAREAANL